MTLQPELARAGKRMRQIGVQVTTVAEGMVIGQLMVQPLRFDPLEPVVIHPLQRFEVLSGHQLRVIGTSPLAQLGPIGFSQCQQSDHVCRLLELSWRELAQRTRNTIMAARKLAKDARLYTDPWRVEGTVEYNGETLRLLFSARGDRACISGLNGRTVVETPRTPRVVLNVEPTDDFAETDRKWRVAVEQARGCLGSSPIASPEQDHISLDLVSRDLETSYACDRRLEAIPAPQPHRPLNRNLQAIPRIPTAPNAYPPSRRERDVSLDLTSDDLPA